MSRLYYLAYGSNLHPLRIGKRLRSARPVGTVELPGYVLEFNKIGGDDSGKGNLRHTGRPIDLAFAVIYSLDARQKPLLDRIEGPGYRVHWWRVQFGKQRLRCFVYLADERAIDETIKPYDWYRDLIWSGADFHRFPTAYIRDIGRQPSISDPAFQRDQRNRHVLRAMHHVNKRRR